MTESATTALWTREARVDDAGQRSDATCEEGFSWGYDARYLVDHACRADFVVNSGYAANPRSPVEAGLTITCSSDDGKRHYCPADIRHGVRIFKSAKAKRVAQRAPAGL